MKATIISTLLNIDEVEFDNIQMERYMRWCENVARIKGVPLQIILANTAVCNYYNAEFHKLEQKFLQIVGGKTKHIESKSLHEFYNVIVVDMYKYYPSALIDEAKKMGIENPPYTN